MCSSERLCHTGIVITITIIISCDCPSCITSHTTNINIIINGSCISSPPRPSWSQPQQHSVCPVRHELLRAPHRGRVHVALRNIHIYLFLFLLHQRGNGGGSRHITRLDAAGQSGPTDFLPSPPYLLPLSIASSLSRIQLHPIVCCFLSHRSLCLGALARPAPVIGLTYRILECSPDSKHYQQTSLSLPTILLLLLIIIIIIIHPCFSRPPCPFFYSFTLSTAAAAAAAADGGCGDPALACCSFPSTDRPPTTPLSTSRCGSSKGLCITHRCIPIAFATCFRQYHYHGIIPFPFLLLLFYLPFRRWHDADCLHRPTPGLCARREREFSRSATSIQDEQLNIPPPSPVTPQPFFPSP